ncbi:MAG TPA: undecaprenyldiphospho-muramoylpentapeptide beta-N-acetylglucosaminyltransferase [Thermoanaerobaculia bacterium]|jgi:UDP-N-acetylglucosamine--N-acetylmuramyl-(pentapeptide) pyrophosphoryl-undecaprenol N-acetylglucosamine transferase|nr:undecaprenyldiphospho-muramoylpentapeptide beta-N-acetylglucosaminyltransferase [Thermoanaerobaculia bacterium]
MSDSTSPSAPRRRHALLAGGGTGGHVFPAIAVGRELAARGWTISYAGSAAGLEARLVPQEGWPFHPLPAKAFLGRGVGAKIGALTTLVRSSVAARALVKRLDVDAVLGTGGYASAPAVVGARLAGRPILLLELNARAGVANRMLARFATAAAVAFEDTRRDLACRSTVTGVPVRSAFFAAPSELPGGPRRLLVLGGSQGARQINRAMPEAARRLLEEIPDLTIRHQAGAKNVDETLAAYRASGLDESALARVAVVPFIEDVAAALSESHLIVSRAGAVTVAEICAAGRPALFLPLTIAKGHQIENARLLERAGAAEVLVEGTPQGSGEPFAARLAARLATKLIDLLADRPGLARRAEAARSLARPGAVAAIADALEAVARGARSGGSGGAR